LIADIIDDIFSQVQLVMMFLLFLIQNTHYEQVKRYQERGQEKTTQEQR